MRLIKERNNEKRWWYITEEMLEHNLINDVQDNSTAIVSRIVHLVSGGVRLEGKIGRYIGGGV